MFLLRSVSRKPWIGFPRMRGDVPGSRVDLSRSGGFSPHARGCSFRGQIGFFRQKVFPACAGMFRRVKLVLRVVESFPRMRGDVPQAKALEALDKAFSPHARGCSAPVPFSTYRSIVFPACAGMFPRTPHLPPNGRGFPRMRGDVPEILWHEWGQTGFSPHARGCSQVGGNRKRYKTVFPACAGMFLPF